MKDTYVQNVDYLNNYYSDLSPNLLSFMHAKSRFIQERQTRRLNYCELGCGYGLSTLIAAAGNPHMDFHANDYNQNYIANAKRVASEAGLGNVNFHAQSFEEFLAEETLPKFDFITMHGIYTWVNDNNRNIIRDFIKRKSHENCIVYLSYNAFPGSMMKHYVQSLLCSADQRDGEPGTEYLQRCFDIAERAAEHIPYGPMIRSSIDVLRKTDQDPVINEYLSKNSRVFYFTDMKSSFGEDDYEFIGSTRINDVESVSFSQEQIAFLDRLDDSSAREAIKDYIRNTSFRTDVYLHKARPLMDHETHDQCLDQKFILTRSSRRIDIKALLEKSNETDNTCIDIEDELYPHMIDALRDGPLSFADVARHAPLSTRSRKEVLDGLLVLLHLGQIDLVLDAPDYDARKRSTDAFNATQLRHVDGNGATLTLASPVTGGGLVFDAMTGILLYARKEPADTRVETVLRLMKQKGLPLGAGGAIHEDEADIRRLLPEVLAEFDRHDVPAFRSLGLI